MARIHDLAGELVGTFILVFFGCGAVAASVVFGSNSGLFQVAAVWGVGVAITIYATRHLSCAHLNPAASLAMVAGGRMTASRLSTVSSPSMLPDPVLAVWSHHCFLPASSNP